jgi:hypothetical protein
MRIFNSLIALIALFTSSSDGLSLNGNGMSIKDSHMLSQKHVTSSSSDALSLNAKGMSIKDSHTLTQKSVTRMSTRRDTIKMPSTTPMVPWKVSGYPSHL